MAWLLLFLAGLLEVVWSLGLRYTEGFTRPGPSVITATAIVASMLLLAHAARTLPIGTAYAVWVGIGVVGATIGGAVLFEEPMTLPRLGFVGLLVVAIVGLRLTSAAPHERHVSERTAPSSHSESKLSRHPALSQEERVLSRPSGGLRCDDGED